MSALCIEENVVYVKKILFRYITKALRSRFIVINVGGQTNGVLRIMSEIMIFQKISICNLKNYSTKFRA